eukprot:COSAG04_NODE_10773_length_754_cov_1.027481_2_plen_67_part_01
MWGPCLLTQVGEALRGVPRSSYFIISKIPSGLNGTVAAEALELALLHAPLLRALLQRRGLHARELGA